MKKSERNSDKQSVVETFNTHARAYKDKFMTLGPYQNSLQVFSNLIAGHGHRLLEVGCGPGNLTKFLWEQNKDLNIMAIDIAEEMVKYAKLNVPSASVLQMDCRNLKSINLSFNSVVCGFCLPYLNLKEAENLLRDISSKLLPGGWLYMSTIIGNYSDSQPYSDSHKVCKPVMTYFYEKDRLTGMLTENGFDMILTEVLPQKHQYQSSKGDLIVIAKKK